MPEDKMKIYEYKCTKCGAILGEQVKEGEQKDHCYCNMKDCGGLALLIKEKE